VAKDNDGWYFGKNIKKWWSGEGTVFGWAPKEGWIPSILGTLGFWGTWSNKEQELENKKQMMTYVTAGAVFVGIWIVQSKWKPR
jgi:hypothetical protein